MAATVLVERGVEVPMRDGTVLRADVWRPAAAGRHPVLLQRTPYDRTSSLISVALAGVEPLRAVEAGYAVVIQDVRGRFGSDGDFRPFEQERDDGVDTVAWAAARPWSDGAVGMYGGSYFGATQLLAASAAPPALRAIAPQVTSSDYHEGWTYQGGAFQLGFVLYWAAGLAAAQLLRRSDLEAEAAVGAILADPWAAYRTLPVASIPALGDVLPAWRDWLAHPRRDAYWRATAPNEDYGRFRAAGLHVAGWNDIFLKGSLENYVGLTAAAAAPQRLVVGPWAHGDPHDTVGEVEFGPSASQLALDPTAVHLRFFDEHLRGGPRDGSPPVRIFVMGRNAWRDEDAWPLARAVERRLHLRAGGRLTWEPPAADEPHDEFVFDPLDPVPTTGGQTYLPGVWVAKYAGPRDQREVERRADVLVYTTAPLERELEVTGPLSATLYAATEGRDTDFTVKLVDVHPDGRALGVVDGILRARYREGLDRPSLLDPGSLYELRIDLTATSHVFLAGHAIRLEVSSSSFPRFDRNPNTGAEPALARADELTPVRQRIFHDAARPSFATLPVVP